MPVLTAVYFEKHLMLKMYNLLWLVSVFLILFKLNLLCYRIVKELSKKQPVSFRAPRLWQGHGQIKILEKLGFKVDASHSLAAHKKQLLPYHPSKENWLEKGKMNILEIPNFAFLDDKNDYSKYFRKNDQWPLLRLLGADFVFKTQKYVIEKQSKLSDICVLLFYLHPWEFEKMP